MISIKELGMIHDAKLLFGGVNLLLKNKNRYAIVGANGAGKTTLLRLLMQQEQPSAGSIDIPKDAQVGCVKQDHFCHDNERIIDVVIQGKEALWAALTEKETLLTGEWNDSAGYRLAELESLIGHHGGYTAEADAAILLQGLGLNEESYTAPFKQLSGGYKIRVLLAQALFKAPTILLLDEPTNHLDIMTIAWLESYLIKSYKGLLIFVSHDVNFLTNTSTHILDIDYGEVCEYPGNYPNFLLKKAENAEKKQHEKAQLEKKIAAMQQFVDRFGAKASKAKQAASKSKMIKKIALPNIQNSSRISPYFSFLCQRPSGKEALRIKNLSKCFGEKRLFNNLSFSVNRGEKIAFIGHNGIGKSTLLKIILNKLQADEGECTLGYETHIGYFSQNHHELLNKETSVFEWLSSNAPQASSTAIRSMLGKMLFSKKTVEKNILNLSGGEAARLLFANIMLAQPNVLVLDEPTNHLDIESIEALAAALRCYEGTVLLVSHDRHFVSQIANRVIAMTEQGTNDFHGAYHEYASQYDEDYLSQAFLKGQTK